MRLVWVRIHSAWFLAAGLHIGADATVAWAQSPPALAVIDGVVTDTTLAPLGDATVSVLGSRLRVVTGANGRFRLLNIVLGEYVLLIRHIGFEPTSARVQVTRSDTTRVSFILDRITTNLDTVVVAAKRMSLKMSEFEERRTFAEKYGGGQFMTEAEINKRNSVFATELIRTFTGIQVVMMRKKWVAASGRAAGSINAMCLPSIWLDGTLLPNPVNLDDLPSPHELSGIEAYVGPARVPLRYALTGNACGTILVWTKDGP